MIRELWDELERGMEGINVEVKKQWKTKAGFDAAVLLYAYDPPDESPGLALQQQWHCGYVRVPETHRFYGLIQKNAIDALSSLDVHGGINFMGMLRLLTGYWIGFDCHHDRDTIETADLDYVIRECERLAEQMAKESENDG